MKGKRISGYCEHNRKGLLCYGFSGRFRTYTCAKELRGNSPLLAGWYEPCEIICRDAPKGTKYNSWDDKMEKNDKCLRQESEKNKKITEKTKKLRIQ